MVDEESKSSRNLRRFCGNIAFTFRGKLLPVRRRSGCGSIHARTSEVNHQMPRCVRASIHENDETTSDPCGEDTSRGLNMGGMPRSELDASSAPCPSVALAWPCGIPIARTLSSMTDRITPTPTGVEHRGAPPCSSRSPWQWHPVWCSACCPRCVRHASTSSTRCATARTGGTSAAGLGAAASSALVVERSPSRCVPRWCVDCWCGVPVSMQRVPPGFDTRNLLVSYVAHPASRYPSPALARRVRPRARRRARHSRRAQRRARLADSDR